MEKHLASEYLRAKAFEKMCNLQEKKMCFSETENIKVIWCYNISKERTLIPYGSGIQNT